LNEQLALLRPLRKVSTAMTNAEKQKAYRAREKAKQLEKDCKLAELEEESRRRAQQVRTLKAKLQKQPSA
jgi:hypothetical protein